MNNYEKAILVGVTQRGEKPAETEEYLEELEFLALTAGAKIVKKFTQRLDKPDPKTFIGSGKLGEIIEYMEENPVDMLIFDDELAPSQIRNIEKLIEKNECKLLDRTNLILDIFAFRANTAQAKTQVELAQCEYMLPRLTRLWTHHSRQKGGIGTKGPGEKELETDRRMLRNKIGLLKEKLKKIDKQNANQRKKRDEKIRVAMVGYTNTGKSTLMNLLSKTQLLAEDKLFATLDTTVRKVVHDRIPYLLSDTVGFIRKLPHNLVESFKSTLDEVREADILLHVVDLSHPQFENQIRVVRETLEELGASDKPAFLVFNKIDMLSNDFFASLNEEELNGNETIEGQEKLALLHKSYLNKRKEKAIFISALKKQNIDELRKKLIDLVIDQYRKVYPYSPYVKI